MDFSDIGYQFERINNKETFNTSECQFAGIQKTVCTGIEFYIQVGLAWKRIEKSSG